MATPKVLMQRIAMFEISAEKSHGLAPIGHEQGFEGTMRAPALG